MSQYILTELPIRLELEDYQKLRARVLRRDGWKCQFCGSMKNLEVHHQEFRSRCGRDAEDNLITLCNGCHTSMHSASST